MSAPHATNLPLEFALVDWANDDLLISDSVRAAFCADHPTMAPLLDWPEFRDFFRQHDGPANQEKRRARAAGWRAVCFAFLAIAFAALSGMPIGTAGSRLATLWTLATSVGAVGFATASFASGLILMLHGESKAHWMLERFWTETLRRFYFQFLLRNLNLGISVMSGVTPLSEWQNAQALALARLRDEELQRPADALRDVLNDKAETKVWTLIDWDSQPQVPPAVTTNELTEYLSVLERKRLQVQKDYTSRKLQGSRLALRRRSAALRTTFYILVFLVLGLDIVVGLLRMFGALAVPVTRAVDLLVLLGALASAAIVALQMLDRGEQISSEAERLEWYIAGIDSIHRRYHLSLTPAEKVRALADLEVVAYQEMRQFLIGVEQGEFLAG